MEKVILISGSNTNVGKTVLTTSLVAYWLKYHSSKSLGLMKLLQTGIGDGELYHQLFGKNKNLEIVIPLSFSAPLAPPLAAEKEGIIVDLAKVWQAFSKMKQSQDFVIVEALGGLGSPVTHELTVANLAADWRLSTILVVPVKLGAISEAVANVCLAQTLKIDLKGIVLSCVVPCSEDELADWASIDLIQSLTQVPVLGTIPYLEDVTDLSKLAQVASDLDLERLLPIVKLC